MADKDKESTPNKDKESTPKKPKKPIKLPIARPPTPSQEATKADKSKRDKGSSR